MAVELGAEFRSRGATWPSLRFKDVGYTRGSFMSWGLRVGVHGLRA